MPSTVLAMPRMNPFAPYIAVARSGYFFMLPST